MKKLQACVLIVMFAVSSCSTVTFKNIPKQDISWFNLHMQIPAEWKIEIKDKSLNAQNSDKTELFDVSAYTFDPKRNLSPDQIIQLAIEHHTPDSPNVPETTVIPFRMVQMPCGEPAAVVVKDLGDNVYNVDYIIASTNSMFHVDFYYTGNPARRFDFYREIIESVSVKGFRGSKCKV